MMESIKNGIPVDWFPETSKIRMNGLEESDEARVWREDEERWLLDKYRVRMEEERREVKKSVNDLEQVNGEKQRDRFKYSILRF